MIAATVLRSTPLGSPVPKWTAIYRNRETEQEVIVSSIERPPKQRTFRVARHGQIKFQRVDLTQLQQDNENNQGGANMARAATKTKKSETAKKKSRKAKQAEDTDLDDELEGLSELDDIEAELDEEPDDVEDGDEEDEEEEKPKRTRSRKSKAGKAAGGKATETAAKSGKAKGKAKASTNGATKEGVGTAELAEAAGVTPRELRVFLRSNKEKFGEKPEGGYRWPSVENKKAQQIIKGVKAAAKE